MQDNITASIVVYKNNPVFLSKAIGSFLTGAPKGKLFIVDNSPDDSLRPLCEGDRIWYFFVGKNLGFGAAHNIAIRKAMERDHRYHLVLNPDVFFEEKVLLDMFQFMDNHPGIGLAMPKVLYPDGRPQYLCRLLPSPLTLIARRLGASIKILGSRSHQCELRFSGYNRIMDVPFLSGCFMFLRLEALKKVGLFDERIFLYTEDMDLTRRIHRHFRTVFYPYATIYHYHERASYKNLRIFFHHAISAMTYFNKWGWFYDRERKAINRATLLKLTQ
jgi:GT2 family glycosyltransferase